MEQYKRWLDAMCDEYRGTERGTAYAWCKAMFEMCMKEEEDGN